MLRELLRISQERVGFRRLFWDEYFDLFIWYHDDTQREIIGFQLCYDKRRDERALTWRADTGFNHQTIDDGEGAGNYPRTPVLAAGGEFDSSVVSRFAESCDEIEAAIAALVLEKLCDYRDQSTLES